MSKRTKQDYNKEFRQRAVRMAISSDKSTAQIARELGVKVTTLYSWVNKEKDTEKSNDEVSKAELFDELKRLKRERGLLWHTDRGSQYASESHREILADHGITQSMSRKGNCWDNAVAESFFHTLKVELIHQYRFKRREEVKQAIFDYIKVFYNRQRLHSTNDYWSPVDYEEMNRIS